MIGRLSPNEDELWKDGQSCDALLIDFSMVHRLEKYLENGPLMFCSSFQIIVWNA
jgi:hypothetical protein